MFVKLSQLVDRESVSDRHGNLNARVVPHREVVYEVDSIQYEKFPACALGDVVSQIGMYTVIFDEVKEGDEFFLVTLGCRNEAPAYIVAASCSLFVMGSDGGTIDVITCV